MSVDWQNHLSIKLNDFVVCISEFYTLRSNLTMNNFDFHLTGHDKINTTLVTGVSLNQLTPHPKLIGLSLSQNLITISNNLRELLIHQMKRYMF